MQIVQCRSLCHYRENIPSSACVDNANDWFLIIDRLISGVIDRNYLNTEVLNGRT